MTPILIALAALAVALVAARSAAQAGSRLTTQEAAIRRLEANLTDSDQRVRTLQQMLALQASGRPLDPEVVEEGRLYDELDAGAAQALLQSEPQTKVLDVRTEGEVTGGHIPGALWVPVEEIEQRYREVPKEGRILVFCAAGARSAAACEFLTSRGWTNLSNVVGGMSSWRGDTQTGRPGSS